MHCLNGNRVRHYKQTWRPGSSRHAAMMQLSKEASAQQQAATFRLHARLLVFPSPCLSLLQPPQLQQPQPHRQSHQNPLSKAPHPVHDRPHTTIGPGTSGLRASRTATTMVTPSLPRHRPPPPRAPSPHPRMAIPLPRWSRHRQHGFQRCCPARSGRARGPGRRRWTRTRATSACARTTMRRPCSTTRAVSGMWLTCSMRVGDVGCGCERGGVFWGRVSASLTGADWSSQLPVFQIGTFQLVVICLRPTVSLFCFYTHARMHTLALARVLLCLIRRCFISHHAASCL